MKQKIMFLFFIIVVCGCGSVHNSLLPFRPHVHLDVEAEWAPHAKTTEKAYQ